jgi:DNA-binding protein H-NS
MGDDAMSESIFGLLHPYSLYGLAVALLEARMTLDELNETNVREYLAEAIETGLGNFRLTTEDDPQKVEVLRFRALPLTELRQDKRLIQSAGLASQGKYLAPSIVTTDGDAKGTFDNAAKMIEKLRANEALDSSFTLSRSFAPTTAKINNGKISQSPPKSSLLEAACSVITTLTPRKPSAWVEMRNTVIIPDLPLKEMRDFIELFQTMMNANLDGNLYEAKLPSKSLSINISPRKKSSKKKEDGAPKSEYRRPRIFNGNYSFAPRNAAFGAAGLLAAIGRWAVEADETAWARRVLESIVGTETHLGRPLYIISYDSISQVQFAHYIVNLSINGKLSQMIDALTRETMLYSDFESNKPSRYSSAFETSYKLFDLMVSHFLQLFNLPAFRDFLATRAEYPQEIRPLFQEYFMNARKIDRQIVESARSLGQWLNRTAYIVADSEVKPEAAERTKKVQKEKAKILVEFESAAMSAKTPQDMLHRISTRAGRLLQRDAPAEATRFYDATNSGEIEPEDALHLLIAYMRLRSISTKEEKDQIASIDGDYPVQREAQN